MKRFHILKLIINSLGNKVNCSCESVMGTFVSRYKNHFDVRRYTNEETSYQEFEIAVNGPNLAHCDTDVK